MLYRCLTEIKERTRFPHRVIVWDNNSESPTEHIAIWDYRHHGLVDSIIYWHENSGPYFPKLVFRSMVTEEEPYYVVSDNDVYPPLIEGGCWLTEMVREMEAWPDLGCLSLQLPPQWLQGPIKERGNHVLATAIGNTCTLIRRSAWPMDHWPQHSGKFGDDGLRSEYMAKAGFHSAFMKNIWCKHDGQQTGWGYTPSQIAADPRKANYGPPFVYDHHPLTYEPLDPKWKPSWKQD